MHRARTWLKVTFALAAAVLIFGLPALRAMAAPSDAPARRALVIGIDGYADPDLHIPGNRTGEDAIEVARVLDDVAGYDTVQVISRDADKTAFAEQLDAFARTIADGDMVVVFYSGHGVEFRGDNYLLMANANAPLPASDAGKQSALEQGAISQRGLLEELRRHNPGSVVLIINACRNDVGGSVTLGDGGDGVFDIPAPSSSVRADKGTMVIYATSSGTPARVCIDRDCSTDTSPMTVFTRELVVALAQPNLPARDLVDMVGASIETAVFNATGEQQLVSYDDQISFAAKKTLFLGPLADAVPPVDQVVAPIEPVTSVPRLTDTASIEDQSGASDTSLATAPCAAARNRWQSVGNSTDLSAISRFIALSGLCPEMVARAKDLQARLRAAGFGVTAQDSISVAETRPLASNANANADLTTGVQTDAAHPLPLSDGCVAAGNRWRSLSNSTNDAALKSFIAANSRCPTLVALAETARQRLGASAAPVAVDDSQAQLPESLRKCAELAAPPYWRADIAGRDLTEDKARSALPICQGAYDADPTSPDAAFLLGLVTQWSGDEEGGTRLFRQAADGGDSFGQVWLGNAISGPQPREAVDLYERAVDQGNFYAYLYLGSAYEWGAGVPKDPSEAARLIRIAADKGFMNAEYALARMYLRGTGVSQDVDEAARWYERSFGHGFVNAGFEYAQLLDRVPSPDKQTDRIADMFVATIPTAFMWPFSLPNDFMKLSPEVRMALQERLRDRGLYKGAIDGELGPGTEKALRALIQP